MIRAALEMASANDASRYDEGMSDAWVVVAKAESTSENEAKAMLLDNLIESLNNEELHITNEWLRLTITRTETF